MLGLIPFWLVWGLQIKSSRKISVITIFSLRTPYVPFPKVRRQIYHHQGLTRHRQCDRRSDLFPHVSQQDRLIAATIPIRRPSLHLHASRDELRPHIFHNANPQSVGWRVQHWMGNKR